MRVWDLVGEDRTLKGEYRAISGRVYVLPVSCFCAYTSRLTRLLRELETILNGTERVNGLSL